MGLFKRTFSAVTTTVEVSAETFEKTIKKLPQGIDRLGFTVSTTLDLADAYLLDWAEAQSAELLTNRVQRSAELEALKQKVEVAGLDWDTVTKPVKIPR